MPYAYVVDNIVQEYIPDYVEQFPGVPAEQRYSADFLNQCKLLPEGTAVRTHWTYDPGTDEFTAPKEIEIEPKPEGLEDYVIAQDEVDAAYRGGVNSVE
jgi:hypothetical protein